MNIFKNNSAFTLVELMVTVIIVGILGAVGMPAYNKYVDNARLAEAYQTLGAMMTQQKAFFYTNERFQTAYNNPEFANGSREITASPGWESVGYPMPLGSMAYYSYGAIAGRDDSNRNEDGNFSGVVSDSIPLVGVGAADAALNCLIDELSVENVKMSSFKPEDMGLIVPAGGYVGAYEWVFLMAMGKSNQQTCRYIYLLTERDGARENPEIKSNGFVKFEVVY